MASGAAFQMERASFAVAAQRLSCSACRAALSASIRFRKAFRSAAAFPCPPWSKVCFLPRFASCATMRKLAGRGGRGKRHPCPVPCRSRRSGAKRRQPGESRPVQGRPPSCGPARLAESRRRSSPGPLQSTGGAWYKNATEAFLFYTAARTPHRAVSFFSGQYHPTQPHGSALSAGQAKPRHPPDDTAPAAPS